MADEEHWSARQPRNDLGQFDGPPNEPGNVLTRPPRADLWTNPVGSPPRYRGHPGYRSITEHEVGMPDDEYGSPDPMMEEVWSQRYGGHHPDVQRQILPGFRAVEKSQRMREMHSPKYQQEIRQELEAKEPGMMRLGGPALAGGRQPKENSGSEWTDTLPRINELQGSANDANNYGQTDWQPANPNLQDGDNNSFKPSYEVLSPYPHPLDPADPERRRAILFNRLW